MSRIFAFLYGEKYSANPLSTHITGATTVDSGLKNVVIYGK